MNSQVTNPNPYVSGNGDAKGTSGDHVTTTSGYTIVFLQRLANPLVPWNAVTNPYMTVDSMPVDLAAYTGENNPPKTKRNYP